MPDPIDLDAIRARHEHHLRSLLAYIHGDGGHHADEHGLEVSTQAAIEAVMRQFEKTDDLRALPQRCRNLLWGSADDAESPAARLCAAIDEALKGGVE